MAGIIGISEAASIGMHACLLLARCQAGQMLRTKEIAAALGVSAAHLAKVLQRLGRAGLIEAVRGPRGGNRLVRPAASVTLLDVYEAIEGHLTAAECLLPRPICRGGSCCLLGGLLQDMNLAARDYLAKISLADACNEIRSPAVQEKMEKES